MNIVADESIPLVNELFGRFGELHLMPGRAISAADVRDADALLIRSVTRVESSMIAASTLRFVGSATIGTDHVDIAALQAHQISFANAPGCNANAVVEYVLASLLVLAQRERFCPGQDVIGILGYGNVGRRLAAKLDALHWPWRVCDPPLAEQLANQPDAVAMSAPQWCSVAELLECEVLTLHVPLKKSGAHPTWYWLNPVTLAQTHARVIINSCRGAVVDNDALLAWLGAQTHRSAVLDVWETEPDVGAELLQRVDLATPHIAGYSLEGKCNGSFRVFEAFCRHFGFDPASAAQWQLPPAGQGKLPADHAEAVLLQQLLGCYDPRRDDSVMRAALADATDRSAAFDRLRKQYPERRELLSWQFAAAADVAMRYRALATFISDPHVKSKQHSRSARAS